MNSNSKEKIIMKKIKELTNFMASKTDPDGSWTGVPLDKKELPQQDVDDL